MKIDNTKLIVVEGIPGSGKTTTARMVHDWLGENGYDARLYLEGDLDHPADFESMACLTQADYAHVSAKYPSMQKILNERAVMTRSEYFISYQKLRNDFSNIVPVDLFDELSRHEIYELGKEDYCRLSVGRWEDFTLLAANNSPIYIFECCFLQNPLTVLMAKHNLNAAKASEHIFRLAKIVKPLNPLMIYLDPSDIRQTLEKAAQNRSKEWLDFVINYVTGQSWGLANGQSGFDGMVHFYEERRNMERSIVNQLNWPSLWLNGAGRDWAEGSKQVISFLKSNIGPGLNVNNKPDQIQIKL
jgi:hypothetical protein